jgi:hypothetical protein
MIAMHPAYEVHRHRENGEVFSIAVLGRLPETEALERYPSEMNRGEGFPNQL